eukprot:7831701-Heterocapsa_arctica.AAC.1
MDELSNGLNYLLKFRVAYDSQINCSTSSMNEPAVATRMVCPRLGPGPTTAGREGESASAAVGSTALRGRTRTENPER